MSKKSNQTTSQINNPETPGSKKGLKTKQSPPEFKQKLSRRQYFFMIIQTQIGVGILSMPYDLHKAAKQDGWISLIIAAVLIQAVIFILWLIGRSSPQDNFFKIMENTMTKWVGKFFSLIYVVYFLSIGVLILLLFGRMISLWVLPSTPFWVLAFLMVLICLYLNSADLLVMGRLYTALSFLLAMLLILMIYSLKEIRLVYILPIGHNGLGPIIKGSHEAILSFFGFIVSLVLFSEVEGKPKDKLKTIFQAHWFVVCFYLFIVMVSFTFFSTNEVGLVPEPVLYMLKSYEFPIVARVDLFFISIWIVSVATTFSTYLYMSSQGLLSIFHSNRKQLSRILVSLIIFSFAFFIGYDMKKIETFTTYVVNSGYFFSIGFPVLIYLCIKIRSLFKKKGGAS
ncbi:spore germination protein [Halobacillus salinarum]|uniref:Spore germination protein n=1 Tax=Halobacillus salinarum TaxID=2932257 RepID=A0ABY4EIA8_9BACI|nr:GerAB/ArcD/ProY family transporter [Halobacillus salinarum]UOQ43608.1 spore germination protein [Halobacillus salinarum]